MPLKVHVFLIILPFIVVSDDHTNNKNTFKIILLNHLAYHSKKYYPKGKVINGVFLQL